MSYTISTTTAWIIGILAVWELVWKGFALWRAAQRDNMAWFVVLLVINSAGILPIVYLLLHRQQRHHDVFKAVPAH